MRTIDSDEDIAAAVVRLTAVEPRFSAVVEAHGRPPLRRMPGGLEGLLRIVADQLLSLTAGAAIWRRVEAELAPFEAAKIAALNEASLMKLGLSRAKARCFRAAATAVVTGSLDFGRLARLGDGDAAAALTAITGVGPWTADIYLLSAMGRADAWPAGDLALQESARHLLGLDRRPGTRELGDLAEPWRPWRSVAARLLWSHYRGQRGLPQSPT